MNSWAVAIAELLARWPLAWVAAAVVLGAGLWLADRPGPAYLGDLDGGGQGAELERLATQDDYPTLWTWQLPGRKDD